jgi:hypothetical protein
MWSLCNVARAVNICLEMACNLLKVKNSGFDLYAS